MASYTTPGGTATWACSGAAIGPPLELNRMIVGGSRNTCAPVTEPPEGLAAPSLESAIRRAGGPPALAYKMAEALQWDLDFARDLRVGDHDVDHNLAMV